MARMRFPAAKGFENTIRRVFSRSKGQQQGADVNKGIILGSPSGQGWIEIHTWHWRELFDSPGSRQDDGLR